MSNPNDASGYIDGEELSALALKLANTFSPGGHEQPMAEAVYGWFEENRIPAYKQPLLPDRSNVVAVLKGTGGGPSLIFNSHMDTEVSGPDYNWGMAQPDINRQGAYREGSRLFGHTVLNDRGLLASTMIVLKALRDARDTGTTLKGDVIVTGVVGETGSAPVDEYQGLSYEGKGIGTRFLISHGVQADYALVAETTDFAISWIACGACYFKVSVPGRNMYTPRSIRPADIRQHPNAIVKMAAVIERIEKWATAYERANTRHTACGTIIPKLSIGSIRGGIPYRPNRTSPHCAIYVDVRVLPGEDPRRVQRELESVVASAEVGAKVEMFLARTGVEGRGVEPLADAVSCCYKKLTGQELPPQAPPEVVGMWRDINVFNAAGIPALTFGPPRRQEKNGGRLYFELQDLVDTTNIYFQVACAICDQSRPS